MFRFYYLPRSGGRVLLFLINTNKICQVKLLDKIFKEEYTLYRTNGYG